MSLLESLSIKALLGTGREAGSLPEFPAPLQEALIGVTGEAGAEAALLQAAAATVLYQRAGQVPVKIEPPPPMPADARPPCSRRAATLLRQLLGGADSAVLIEWFTHCARAGRKPPAEMLPAILDAPVRRQEHRARLMPLIQKVTGEPGLWLAKLNPQWAAYRTESTLANSAEIWATGSKPQRVSALTQQRRADPAAARELLRSTFAAEPAADRAAFLAVLSDQLSVEDESFLEEALEDRSRDVRAAAAGLLSRLPASAWASRMLSRVSPLLKFTPPQTGGLLRRGKNAMIEVQLPAAFDDQMKRDGLEQKPPVGSSFGERQHWLLQMLTLVPPGHWANLFAASPEAILQADKGDFHKLLSDGLRDATLHFADAVWAEALLRQEITAQRYALNHRLINLLPADRRGALLHDLLSTTAPPLETVRDLILGSAIDAPTARLVLHGTTSHLKGAIHAYDHRLAQLLPALALSVPPQLLKEFETAWPAEMFGPNKKIYDQFFATLSMRLHIQQEFSQ